MVDLWLQGAGDENKRLTIKEHKADGMKLLEHVEKWKIKPK